MENPKAGAEVTFKFSAAAAGSKGGMVAGAGQRGEIPSMGLGTATLRGEVCVASVRAAIRAGLRHIDTALLYNNQGHNSIESLIENLLEILQCQDFLSFTQ